MATRVATAPSPGCGCSRATRASFSSNFRDGCSPPGGCAHQSMVSSRKLDRLSGVSLWLRSRGRRRESMLRGPGRPVSSWPAPRDCARCRS
ncbi:hypothetical protein ACFPRL_19555 [Pseudoclavibacter helvolus]